MSRALANIWRRLRELVLDLAPSRSNSDGPEPAAMFQDDVMDAARDPDGMDATGL